MNRKNIIGGAVVIAVGAVATWYVVANMATDEQRVTRVIKSILEAIEDKDRTAVCQHLTVDYHDGHGHGTRAELRGTLRGLPVVRSIDTDYEDLNVVVTGDAATATFVATVAAKQPGRARPWQHRTRVRLHFRKTKEDGEWRVYHAEYNIPPNILRSLRMAG